MILSEFSFVLICISFQLSFIWSFQCPLTLLNDFTHLTLLSERPGWSPLKMNFYWLAVWSGVCRAWVIGDMLGSIKDFGVGWKLATESSAEIPWSLFIITCSWKKWRHFFYIKQKFLLNQTCLQDANLEISLQNIMCIFLYKFHIVHFDYMIIPNSSHIYFPPSITHPSNSEFSFSSSFYFSFSIKSSLCCLAILRCRAFSGVALAYKASIHDMTICHVKASSISQQLLHVNSFTGSSRIPCPLPSIHPDLCLASTCASLGHAAPVVWGLYM